MGDDCDGMGLGGLLAGWAALGWLLRQSIKCRHQEMDRIDQMLAKTSRNYSLQAEQEIRAYGLAVEPTLKVSAKKVRRLTNREAFKALMEGRLIEACHERIREAEEATAAANVDRAR